MAITIQIDAEVQQELAMRASKEEMDVFSYETPNRILRIILEMDQPSTQAAPLPNQDKPPLAASSSLNDNITPQTSDRTHKRIGLALLRRHPLKCKKGYFSKTGKPYQKPDVFPVALFDLNGYLMLNDDASMRSNAHINVGAQVNIPEGISRVPGYVRCGHVHG